MSTRSVVVRSNRKWLGRAVVVLLVTLSACAENVTAAGDLAVAVDLARPPDLVSPVDLVPWPDLVPPPDLLQPPTCTDSTRNGDESDVDCGGAACPRCAVGAACAQNGNCSASACVRGRCSLVRSCLDLHTAQGELGDGVYTIDPDLDGGIAPLKVFCDMTTDGGGWTLVHKNNLASSNDRTDNGANVAALLSPTVDDVAVLPRATLAAISPAREFRVLAANGYKIYSRGGMPYYTTDQHDGASYTGTMKYDWSASWGDQPTFKRTPGDAHATPVCPASSGCSETDTGHISVQRWCCGAPNNGFWFNGSQRFKRGYYAGTGWLR